jgi:hypothetical protein
MNESRGAAAVSDQLLGRQLHGGYAVTQPANQYLVTAAGGTATQAALMKNRVQALTRSR